MTGPARTRASRQPGPALAVLLGHAVLVAGLWHALLPVRPRAGAPLQPPLLVWLRPTAAEPGRPPPAPTSHRAAPVSQLRRSASHAPPAAAQDGPAPSGPPIGWVAPAQQAAAPPAAPASAPLNLRWQPARGAAPSAIDLVRNAPGQPAMPDRDARLAQALGTDTTLREEDRGAVRRFRRGSTCVDTRATRESQINPSGAAAGTMPRLAEPC